MVGITSSIRNKRLTAASSKFIAASLLIPYGLQGMRGSVTLVYAC
jgi:hypothetical protein